MVTPPNFDSMAAAFTEDQATDNIITHGPVFDQLVNNLKAPCQKQRELTTQSLFHQILENVSIILPETPSQYSIFVRPLGSGGYKAVVLEDYREEWIEGPQGRDAQGALEGLLEMTREILGEEEGEEDEDEDEGDGEDEADWDQGSDESDRGDEGEARRPEGFVRSFRSPASG